MINTSTGYVEEDSLDLNTLQYFEAQWLINFIFLFLFVQSANKTA